MYSISIYVLSPVTLDTTSRQEHKDISNTSWSYQWEHSVGAWGKGHIKEHSAIIFLESVNIATNLTVEWGEAVEALSEAVVNNAVDNECPDIRRCTVFLSHRILRRLQLDMRDEKSRRVSNILLSHLFINELL